ncbi:MAG TPA: amidohydrolase family protein [Planctomycetota bacterium]|nr:amidohydrolase family protein [Planctomycetota bacterium]
MIGLLLALPALGSASGEEAFTLRAREIHIVSGARLEDSSVGVRDGKISGVGRGAGGRVLEGGSITPGLIDAASTAGIAGGANEESSEVAPSLRVLDSLDPKSRAMERLARAGVTTVFVSPGTRGVIGGLGAVVKTGGASLETRVVVPAAALKGAMGDDPSRGNIPIRFGTPTSFYFRRPTTRMGVVWLFRKAFFDAKAYRERGRSADEDMETLLQVVDGKRRLRLTARRLNDIRTTLRLAAEFGLKVEIDGADDAHRCAEELAAREIAVVAGPIPATPVRGRFAEVDEPCLANAALLAKAGVLLALTAGDRDGEEALPGQALFAMRYGLPFEGALRAVTLDAARILGVESRVGSIEEGKDADLVLWEEAPFASRPLAVLIDGRLVYDAASDPDAAAPEGR